MGPRRRSTHALPSGQATASVDALCPFGGVETLVTWVTTGQPISRTHPSNLVLGLAVLVAVLLVGNVLCGWVCPFGAVQDMLSWVGRQTHIPQLRVPAGWDKALRWGRVVVLALVIYASVSTAKLWFADYDPYATLFGLRWLIEPDASMMAVSLGILALTLLGSLVVDRFWFRYLCRPGRSVLGSQPLQPRPDPPGSWSCRWGDRAWPRRSTHPADREPAHGDGERRQDALRDVCWHDEVPSSGVDDDKPTPPV